GIRDKLVTGVQTCALPICQRALGAGPRRSSRRATSSWRARSVWIMAAGRLNFGISLRALSLEQASKPSRRVLSLSPVHDNDYGRSEERRVGKECSLGRWCE